MLLVSSFLPTADSAKVLTAVSKCDKTSYLPLPSSPTPANPPLDLSQLWQGLLTEQTALLGSSIDPPPDRPPNPPTPPPIANPSGPGQSDRTAMEGDRISSALMASGHIDVRTCAINLLAIPSFLELAEARREQEKASDGDSFAPGVRPTLARTSAIRSHFTPLQIPTRPPRLPRRRDRSSRRRAGVGFSWVA
jgi:hypothetical protein